MILYGINNCDTVRKARRWLEQNELDYQFHDYRRDGIDSALVNRLESVVGWELMLNRRSTSWRQLSESERLNMSGEKARRLMVKQPTLIKRPLLETAQTIVVGFNPALYNSELSNE